MGTSEQREVIERRDFKFLLKSPHTTEWYEKVGFSETYKVGLLAAFFLYDWGVMGSTEVRIGTNASVSPGVLPEKPQGDRRVRVFHL